MKIRKTCRKSKVKKNYTKIRVQVACYSHLSLENRLPTEIQKQESENSHFIEYKRSIVSRKKVKSQNQSQEMEFGGKE